MAPGLMEALRSLCCRHGWSYGVVWSVGRDDPRLLTLEEAYCEEQIRMVIDNTLHQVHRVGKGIIGEPALSGKSEWIFLDTYCREWSLMGPIDNTDMFQGNSELQLQYLAGIKTIAIVSLLPFGVVQFGSTQKVLESTEFINQVKHMCQQLRSTSRPLLCGDAHNAINSETHGTLYSVISSGDSYCTCKNIKDLHNYCYKETMCNDQYSTLSVHSSNPFALGSHLGSMHANVLAVPVTPSLTCAGFSSENSFYLRNRLQAAGAAASLSNHLVAGHTHTTWSNEISTLSSIEQRLLSGIETKAFPSMFPTNSHSTVSQGSLFQHFCRNSNITSLNTLNGSHDTRSAMGSLGISKPGPYSVGKSLDLPYSSTLCPVVEGNITNGKSLSKGSSLGPEPPAKSVTFPGDLTAERATMALSEPNPLNNLIQSNAIPLQQVNYLPTVQGNDNLPGVFSASSGLSGGDDFSSIAGIDAPSRPVENSTARTINFLAAGCDGKENSLDAPEQLLSDVDLFHGMDLDLEHVFQGQGCWDDIFMPVESGNCPNFSISVSECFPKFEEDVMAGPEKGFFSEFGLEQLLEAVGGGSVDSAASHSSVGISGNSVASLKLENQISTSTRVGDTTASSSQAPLVGPSCVSGSTDLLLPGCNLEKIMRASPQDALSKSQLSCWVDDSYNMNAKSAVTMQPKKAEESVKVARKRARPGESTRPRPKDRQQIQDRVKELREIVPNGAKCSIDALLDHTIKHMLFLQGMVKYADKYKQADEPKMIVEESGVVLKDNSGGGGGGATWAFEVAGQTMVCPIIVEDLNPPGQMLVEMLCEERGFFLEIADIIRGFGLTILKGMVEARENKIWARFLVEANRDVTRMDIFLSLVQLLQQTSSACSSGLPAKIIDSGIPTFSNFQQPPMQIPISMADGMR